MRHQPAARDLRAAGAGGGGGGRSQRRRADAAGRRGAAPRRVLLNVNATQEAARQLLDDPARNIHFVRDPRDALVSNHFSWRYSHRVVSDSIAAFRRIAGGITVEEGLVIPIDKFPMGRQLAGWTEAMWGRVTPVACETLLDRFDETLQGMLAPAGIALPPALAQQVRTATSFESIAGRARGEEDPTNHFRKGVPGDWRNHFTPRVEAAFTARWGWLTERLGYAA